MIEVSNCFTVMADNLDFFGGLDFGKYVETKFRESKLHPVDTGFLQESWRSKEENGEIDVFNIVPYGPVVNFGLQKEILKRNPSPLEERNKLFVNRIILNDVIPNIDRDILSAYTPGKINRGLTKSHSKYNELTGAGLNRTPVSIEEILQRQEF